MTTRELRKQIVELRDAAQQSATRNRKSAPQAARAAQAQVTAYNRVLELIDGPKPKPPHHWTATDERRITTLRERSRVDELTEAERVELRELRGRERVEVDRKRRQLDRLRREQGA